MTIESVGKSIIGSDAFLRLQKREKSAAAFAVKTMLSGAAMPVPPEFLPRVVYVPPYLALRQLLANLQTTSNLVEAPQEASKTGTVDYQTTEGSSKASTDFTFTLGQFPVCTIATTAKASTQVMDDSAALAGYIDTRLAGLVEDRVEKELLYGDGATGHITGLTINATAGSATGATTIDKISGSMITLATAGIIPDGIVLNPADWLTIISAKNASGSYPAGFPLDAEIPPTIWGFPVALSIEMQVGHYLVGGFQYAAIYNRMNATVDISRFDQSNFIQNLLTLRAEERLALAIYKPTAFVYGAV